MSALVRLMVVQAIKSLEDPSIRRWSGLEISAKLPLLNEKGVILKGKLDLFVGQVKSIYHIVVLCCTLCSL